MASGQLVDLEATWEGTIEVEGVKVRGSFEVFDSGGGWSFLFGKPLQTAFSAVHDYKQDVVSIEAGGKQALLRNQQGEPWWTNFKPASSVGTHAAFTGVLSNDRGGRRRGGEGRIGKHDGHRGGGGERRREGRRVGNGEGEWSEAEASVGRGGGGRGARAIAVVDRGVYTA
ncbi:hypothetical protein K438DRAFT_1762530 [Mycena galopus ATCC 62051]|nr:hypothetical protein K438DRAFT_1762530 [Mycena galopus ATCC 62051]